MTDYDTAVLAANPDGYWKCDDAAGATLADSAPGNHPLVGSGCIENWKIPGPSTLNIPFAIDFLNVGTDPICATTTVGSYGIGSTFTVEGWWAGVGTLGGHRSTILEKGFGTAGESRPWWMLGIDTNGDALFWFRNVAGTDFKLVATGPFNDATYPNHGPFHHFMGTFNPSTTTAKLYVDGIPAVTLTVPNTGWGTSAQGLSAGIFAADKSGSWLAACAIYPSLFTDAGALDHFQQGILGNAFSTSQLQTSLTQLVTDLSAVLAAVRKTY